jgi:ketosteroid isomerase-like protein
MGTKSLSADEMLAVFMVHATAEFAGDVDTTMETVAEHPVFEWAPLNLRIEGRDAVREMYSRVMSRTVHKHILSQRALAFGENVITVEYVLTVREPDKEDVHTAVMTVLGFEGDKIWAERTYTHPAFAEHLREGLGEDFDSFPGVSQLEYGSVLSQTVPAPWYQPAATR